MGQRLARHFHGAGFAVAVTDPSQQALEKVAILLPDVTLATAPEALEAAWKTPDLVIEAVPEKLPLKHAVFAAAEAFFAPKVLIASNTSGLTTAELTAHMRHPERLAIAHFFNPADVIPVVEVIGSAQMPPERLQQLAEVLEASGKIAAVLHREVAGFVANRIQHAMMREALHLLEEGVADAQTLDQIIRWSIGVRLAFSGPFLQRDLNGLDTHLNIANYLYPQLGDAKVPASCLKQAVEAGQLGRKAGQGFYAWDAAREQATQKSEQHLTTLIKDMMSEREIDLQTKGQK